MYDLVVREMAPKEKLASSITPRKQVTEDRNPNPFEDYLEAQKEELPVGMDEIANKSRRAAEGIRSKLLAKRPHGRLRRLSAELENVGERRGSLRPFRTSRKNPEKIWVESGENSVKFWQICETLEKNQQFFSNF